MEPVSTDSTTGGDTLTAYDFAMEEVGIASSNLARALLARVLARGAMPDRECAEARSGYTTR
jgi:hypothetical protein